jgi:uncharacterized damage-inducible protein DinB
MQTKWSWFERRFEFDFPPEKLPDIVERLRGTPARISDRLVDVDTPTMHYRADEKTWSIQQNVGHLLDLEPLWIGRLDDILNQKPTMREADLSNQSTFDAGHNDCQVTDVLARFSDLRGRFVDTLESQDFDKYSLSARHPRLKKSMRVVDLAHFVAEHDDYHLARITYLTSNRKVRTDA